MKPAKTLFSWACVIGALSLGQSAPAQVPPPAPSAAARTAPLNELTRGMQDVTLRELFALLHARSPRARATESQIEVARAATVAARAYPNPTLSYNLLYGIEQPDYIKGTQHQVMLEQPLLIGGQRGAREKAADLGTAAAKAQARSDYDDLAQQVRASYVSLLAAEERVRTLDDARAALDQAQHIVEGRVQGGMLSAYDRLRTDVEARALDARSVTARTEFDDASGRLAGLMGLPGWRPRAVGNLRTEAHAEPSAPFDPIPKLPAVVAANKEVTSARAQIDVARSERWPTPVVGVGAMFTTNGFTLAGSFGLNIDLPLFDRGQGAIARAQADALTAERTLDVTTAEARAELLRARRALIAHERALSGFESDVISRLPELRRMAEDAYTTGRATILDLLDTLRTDIETRLTEIDYLEATALARIELLAAEGRVESDDTAPTR